MSKFICGIVTATSAIIGIIGAIAVPAVGSPLCMTKEEARKAYPRDHIYWHGPQRCWDNNGEHRRQRLAVKANPNGGQTKPSEIGTPSEPVVDKPSEPVAVSPVPFISNDPSYALFWPALNVPARAQQDDPAPPPPPPAAKEDQEDIVIGAPNAAPGSPDYLLEHCCWPLSLSDGTREDGLLPRMVIASTSACGLAIGLWLFVYRRRQLVRSRWS